MTRTQYRKRIDVEKRVREALEACVAAGEKPSFYAIAQRVGVARSTIYRRDDLRNLVEAGRDAWTVQNQRRRGARKETRGRATGEARENISADAPVKTGCACTPCAPMRELQARIDLLERQLEQAQIQIDGLASLLERLDQPGQPIQSGQSSQVDQPVQAAQSNHRIHTGPRAVQSYIATLSITGSGADATVRLESCIAA